MSGSYFPSINFAFSGRAAVTYPSELALLALVSFCIAALCASRRFFACRLRYVKMQRTIRTATMNMPMTRPIRRPVLSVLFGGDIYVRERNIAEGRTIVKTYNDPLSVWPLVLLTAAAPPTPLAGSRASNESSGNASTGAKSPRNTPKKPAMRAYLESIFIPFRTNKSTKRASVYVGNVTGLLLEKSGRVLPPYKERNLKHFTRGFSFFLFPLIPSHTCM
jgi:hypothetical protein